ncbi:MAG: hypothetical protein J6W29_09875, partial [Neisseriaceae bacterium]|nr:hypothetical protein [Neisseriaceae bacterium]
GQIFQFLSRTIPYAAFYGSGYACAVVFNGCHFRRISYAKTKSIKRFMLISQFFRQPENTANAML